MRFRKTNGLTFVHGEEHWVVYNNHKRRLHDLGNYPFINHTKTWWCIECTRFLVFLPMIALSTFIVLGLAGIGLNTLYEEELAEEEKQDERI